MKPFDLSAALRGDKVVTRDGQEISEIYYFKTAYEGYPVVVVISGTKYCFKEDGKFTPHFNDKLDLFMASTKKKGWINIIIHDFEKENFPRIQTLSGAVFSTKEKAYEDRPSTVIGIHTRVKQIEIEWEE